MIIISRKYIPTDAAVIRAMSLASGIADLGEQVSFIFLIPSEDNSLPDSKTNLHYSCVSGTVAGRNRYLNASIAVANLHKHIKKDDTVILMSFLPVVFIYLSFLCKRLYHDRTEMSGIFFSKTLHGRLLEKIYINRANKSAGVFVISQSLRKDLIDKGADESKIYLLNMMVDCSRFDGIIKNTLSRYICYCGTVSNYKDGVNTLIKAFRIVHDRFNDIQLYIIGRYFSESDRNENVKIIEENNLQDVVYMPGIVSYDELPNYLKNAEVLALARPNNEQAKYGFPNKLGEYLATGNPVVVTKVGEIDNYLEDRISCVFAEPDNEQSFADALIWCLSNCKEAEKIGEKGREVAMSKFDYHSVAANLLKVINS